MYLGMRVKNYFQHKRKEKQKEKKKTYATMKSCASITFRLHRFA